MERRYWDSDSFLGFLNEEEGKVELCAPVLRRAEEGQLQIVTSALTMVEVLWMKDRQRIPHEQARVVHDFFERECFVMVNLDRTIAEKAREVVWNHGIKPKDAVHVATALDQELEVLETFDIDLIGKSGTFGHQGLEIRQPHAAGSLFD